MGATRAHAVSSTDPGLLARWLAGWLAGGRNGGWVVTREEGEEIRWVPMQQTAGNGDYGGPPVQPVVFMLIRNGPGSMCLLAVVE